MQRAIKQAPVEPTFLTKATYDSYQAEVRKLRADHEIVMKRLIEAREMGDLSENGAYQYAKFELAAIKRKLHRLSAILSTAQVLQKPLTNEVVSLGCTVTISTGTDERTYTIVSKHEADPSKNTISDTSPIGSALIGKHLQEQVAVVSPRGTTTYTISNIS